MTMTVLADAHAEWRPDILREHLEDLVWLGRRRNARAARSEMAFGAWLRLDRRIRAHADALVLAGRFARRATFFLILSTICAFSCRKTIMPHAPSRPVDPPRNPSTVDTSQVSIRYMNEVGWSGTKSARFSYGRDSVLLVTFSYDPLQEIGSYRGLVDEAKLREAHRSLQKSGYADAVLDDYDPPETKHITFGEERVDQKVVLKSFPKRSIPPTLLAPIAQFEALVGDLRKHPRRAIQAAAAFSRSTLSTNEDIELSFELRATGVAPMSAGNPLVNEEDAKAKLSLTISALNDPNRRATVELRREHLVSGDRGDAPLLRLVPGQRWSVVLAKRMHLSPGSYDVHLSYRSFDVAEPGHVEGEIPIPLGTLTVTPAR
jgi:hypothetical protein